MNSIPLITPHLTSLANGRIPAIVDKTSGTSKRVFEGASIQLYLTAKYDSSHKISFPYDSDEYWEMVEWLVWMQSGKHSRFSEPYVNNALPSQHQLDTNLRAHFSSAGIGPMQGQANHFYRYAPQKIEYAVNRYQTETKRLYQVLNDRLAAQETSGQGLWIVGSKYTIADICCFSWVNWAEWYISPFLLPLPLPRPRPLLHASRIPH